MLIGALLGGCTSLPAKQHTGIYTIEVAGTNSMIPAIHEGELISITPCDYSRLHAGMVVAYQRASGATMIHRLIRSETFGWVAKGDHNQNYDHLTASMAELVTPENFIGIWIDSRDKRTWP